MRLATLLVFAWTVSAQETPTFQAKVALVQVHAEVIAGDGRVLSGFGKQDFRIFDNGKEQQILHFSAGEDPLDLILLFDTSGSMKPKVQQVAAAAREGVHELRDGDRVAIMTFDTRTRLVLPFTDDLDRVERAIRRDVMGERFGGGTFIQSAVSDAARKFMQEPRTERRRAILIVTDNMGQRTRRESTVIRELWEADALLTALVVSGGPMQTMYRINTILNPSLIALHVGVRGIAAKTGGDFLPSGDPAAGFQESMRRIRNRYSLFYAMPEAKPNTRRLVKVELARETARKHAKAKIRARTGYFTPGEGRPANPR